MHALPWRRVARAMPACSESKQAREAGADKFRTCTAFPASQVHHAVSSLFLDLHQPAPALVLDANFRMAPRRPKHRQQRTTGKGNVETSRNACAEQQRTS
ncbi:hypothetical protein BaRGS_00024183 [Batillaria attramentaria]|uniref:Uncharacterized protein n=1 Tax=Batillaria attramentaria TaxID=370345 RepID=A0ABD0KC64_9CAEN